MSKLTIREHNITTGEIIDRDMTVDEIAQYELEQEQAKQEQAKQATKDAARQAVLDKLGLSADEIAALLG